MATLFLVRHGEAVATWSKDADPALSEKGVAQAREVAATLIRETRPPLRLLSSPLRRACETAAPLADVLAAPVEISDAFREIPTPVPLAERQNWLRRFMGETWDRQGAEIISWRSDLLDALMALKTDSVIFTHFLVINTVVGHAEGRIETLSFWPENGSVTRLENKEGRLKVVSLGHEMKTVVN